MTEALCATCKHFAKDFAEIDAEESIPRRTVAPNVYKLEESAQNGCHLCQIIYQSFSYQISKCNWSETLAIHLSAYKVLRYYRKDTAEGQAPCNQDPKEPKVWCGIGKDIDRSRWHPLPLVTHEEIEAGIGEWDSCSTRSIADLSSAEGVEKAITLAKRWMQNCSTSHEKCGMQPGGPDLIKTIPTRLIHVGSKDGALSPKIIITNPSSEMEYLALSYAWGSGHDFAKTTATNLVEMTKHLPWDDLAKTVQDAIIFTRKLGYKYLWVDALCILQSEGPDDQRHKDDWSYEAARFGQYYENATLTIAASGAISSQQGLFLDRPALCFDPQPVTLTIDKISGGTTHVEVQPPSPSWELSIQNVPLLTRGWAIQERVLSKRILHFGASCLLWECRELKTTEANPNSSEPKVYGYLNEEFVSVFRNLENRQQDELITLWYQFVEVYSGTNFSFYRDKLPALSGIAKRIQSRFPQDYIAGIWESSIPQGLLWVGWGGQEPEVDPSRGTNRPSWCWASPIHQITFLPIMTYCKEQYLTLQVKSWSVRTNGPQTSGQILEGSVTIRGPVKSFNLYDLNLDFVFGPEACDREGNAIKSEAVHGIRKPEDRIGYLDYTNFLGLINRSYTCILVAKLLPSMWTPAEKRVIGAALILEATGRVGAVDQCKRIGVVCLPFEEYWANVEDSKTVELV
ncbi:heterokaryon incompatibility protein-domain-containing protein [Fusarium sp. MPI-SDFR-AT-0072]|nr:heterokaryon incompatibility protein-domain-containing protein [Fusarium sp. MPI-SDFR-AT-0072]